jgi:uncharacterized Zn finger protein
MKPPIQETQIRNRASQQSYSRGEGYYKSGAIFATVRRGNEIEGRCAGSGEESYHVHATLDESSNIEETFCTCEYDYGGDCKHIVALLLTYLREPELFEEAATVQDTLAERSKEELITLIREIVARYPEAKTIIDRPVPRPSSKGETVDLSPFQRELRQALSHFNHWGDRSAQYTIHSIADAARAFADAGQWHNASAIYRTILEEFTSQEQYPADDDGDLIWALNPVVEALLECLKQDEISVDEDERRLLIERLMDVYIWDIENGGYGLGEGMLPHALLQHLRPEDIPGVRARLLDAQRRSQKSPYGMDSWVQETLERFQLQLDTLESTDPDETLQRLRGQGLYRLLFEKLMALGRVDEAIEVVAKDLTNSYQRLLALPHLVDAGRKDEAIRLANVSLRAGFDGRMAQWLAEEYQRSDDRNALFELRLLGMKQQPSEAYYAALKEAAEAIGVWGAVRPDILKGLAEKKEYHILAQVYLYDEEWDAAWQTLEQIPKRSPQGIWGWVGSPGFDLEVAARSKEARPHKAIPIFIKYARQQIEGRKREHYSQAASYLSTVRDLYKQIDEQDAWRELIQGIRDEFRRLRALQDELKRAGL